MHLLGPQVELISNFNIYWYSLIKKLLENDGLNE